MNNPLFRLIPAAGILALGAAFAAGPSSIPRNEPAPEAISAPAQEVTLFFKGAQRISENGRGGLDVVQADGTLRHYQPTVYQTINGKRKMLHYTCHVIDSNHVELKTVHSDASAPLQVAPGRTNS